MTWGELKQAAVEMGIPDDVPVLINNSFMYDEQISGLAARRVGGASSDVPVAGFVIRTYDFAGATS